MSKIIYLVGEEHTQDYAQKFIMSTDFGFIFKETDPKKIEELKGIDSGELNMDTMSKHVENYTRSDVEGLQEKNIKLFRHINETNKTQAKRYGLFTNAEAIIRLYL